MARVAAPGSQGTSAAAAAGVLFRCAVRSGEAQRQVGQCSAALPSHRALTPPKVLASTCLPHRPQRHTERHVPSARVPGRFTPAHRLDRQRRSFASLQPSTPCPTAPPRLPTLLPAACGRDLWRHAGRLHQAGDGLGGGHLRGGNRRGGPVRRRHAGRLQARRWRRRPRRAAAAAPPAQRRRRQARRQQVGKVVDLALPRLAQECPGPPRACRRRCAGVPQRRAQCGWRGPGQRSALTSPAPRRRRCFRGSAHGVQSAFVLSAACL